MFYHFDIKEIARSNPLEVTFWLLAHFRKPLIPILSNLRKTQMVALVSGTALHVKYIILTT